MAIMPLTARNKREQAGNMGRPKGRHPSNAALHYVLKKCVSTFGAMNTQKDTVAIIIRGNGDYVGGLKGIHKKLGNYSFFTIS